MSARPQVRGLDQLLAAKEVVIVCGPGGVGKTTTAAALAAGAAAVNPGRILVVTVDPARRLADALGVGPLDDEPRRIPDSAFGSARHRPKGELWAAMLDARRSWDGLVERYAPDSKTATEILDNPLYRNITGRFARSQEYIAMERLFEIHARGEFDLIIVDTPPTRNALDFLDAPGKMAEFFSSTLLRWLTAPYRSRLVGLASRPFYQVADRILGTQFLADIARFFLLLQTMYGGFVERARAVNELVHGPTTTFVVVTTLESAPAAEAEQFIDALATRHLHLGLLIANRVLPAALCREEGAAVADALVTRAEAVADGLRGRSHDGLGNGVPLEGVLTEIGQSFLNFRLVANREAELFAELEVKHELSRQVPYFAGEITDVRALLEVAGHLFERSLRRPARPGKSAGPAPVP